MQLINVYPQYDTNSKYEIKENEWGSTYKQYADKIDGFKIVHYSNTPAKGVIDGETLDNLKNLNSKVMPEPCKTDNNSYVLKQSYDCGTNGTKKISYYESGELVSI